MRRRCDEWDLIREAAADGVIDDPDGMFEMLTERLLRSRPESLVDIRLTPRQKEAVRDFDDMFGRMGG